jgi:hypothetical protein
LFVVERQQGAGCGAAVAREVVGAPDQPDCDAGGDVGEEGESDEEWF